METSPHQSIHPGSARDYAFRVLDHSLSSRTIALPDSRVLGRQIADASGHRSVDTALIVRRQRTGLISIGLDELVDISGIKPEEFIIGTGDRMYLLNIDGVRSEWPFQTVTGAVVRQLADRDEGSEVVLELEDVPDRVLADADQIDLGAEGIERFHTRTAVREVIVFYNTHEFRIARGPKTTQELKAIFQVRSGYILDLIAANGDFQELADGQTTTIVAGLKFVSHAPSGQSS